MPFDTYAPDFTQRSYFMNFSATLGLILGLSLSATSLAADRDAEFERKVNLLGKLAFGTTTTQAEPGKAALEVLIEMAMESRGETREETLENFLVDSDGSGVEFADQSGWGTLTLVGAMNIYNLDDDNEDAQKKRNAKMKLGNQLIKELSKMGAKFGFSDSASGYCGLSFVGLLVIDEKTGKVYEIALTNSGSC
jgi:hypothetical protein